MIFSKPKQTFLGVYYDAIKDTWIVREYMLWGIIWKTVAHFDTMVSALAYVKSNSVQDNINV